jgi:glucokinase
MGEKALIGIDIGGTKINIGKTINGHIVQELRLPTESLRPEDQIIKDLIHGIEQVIDNSVTGIGVGVPGLVDENGIVYNLTNIPSWKEVHLKHKLESYFNLPVQVANDANCFVLGEKVFGKGINYSNLIGITLGTGLGVGIILFDNLYTGRLSIAGEFAEMPYSDSNFENYCSSKFFQNRCQLSAKSVSEKAYAGEPGAIEIFNEFGGHLGSLIQSILLAYGPDAIVFGGSLAKSFDLFYPAILNNLKGFSHQNVLQHLKILQFAHEKIPLMGAAALTPYFMNKENQQSSILFNP